MAPREGKLTCVCAPSWAITVAAASCCSIFLVPGARVPRLRRRVARERGREQLVRLACVSRGSHGTHMGAIFGVSPRPSASPATTAPGRQSTSRKLHPSPGRNTITAPPTLSPPGQPPALHGGHGRATPGRPGLESRRARESTPAGTVEDRRQVRTPRPDRLLRLPLWSGTRGLGC